ncbi:uncharacterized protein LOC128261146 [Drosophila gunungcola]|uniref:MARVEL domain-containing protein n=1 Tax=Drosophila gunungcola TaxID=103775 RepID=A0A9P9YE26_9MUSC|nr:uncharacterized protein LOC108142829 [Drosophila elegans]XP_017122382.1 uncharacterized protein LOC108142829 [Drosophila elegans]XP_052850597.1 uncharacterized protein LOC128261146 [Drosophila gunungcola]XP_052850599.1 uncharacterized protein LOC128261146 [Drosophila gunungcola]XP_052850600.1 uncharacterized protein LOC128261146 [Drosophila gunungcola]KAI8034823.1 hypothetical protein M5D96_012339 [Drosophila gunungcola]
MSHSVTITRTTTSTTNTSYIVLNTGYLKTFPGILKLFQLIIGAAIVGILAYNYQDYRSYYSRGQQDLFQYLMAVTFMIGTFCLLLACLTSLSTGGIIAKTIYELIYHSVAAILILVSSTFLLIRLRDVKHDAYMVAGVLGLVNAVLYFISAFLAHRSYRGI